MIDQKTAHYNMAFRSAEYVCPECHCECLEFDVVNEKGIHNFLYCKPCDTVLNVKWPWERWQDIMHSEN